MKTPGDKLGFCVCVGGGGIDNYFKKDKKKKKHFVLFYLMCNEANIEYAYKVFA